MGSAFYMQRRGPAFEGVGANTYNIQEVPRHPVTKDMWINAESYEGHQGPKFELLDTDEKSVKSSELIGTGKPTVLVMTKDGCPCSVESQPFWTSMAMYYGERVKFFGIIDADSKGGSKFKTDFGVPYPILSSTDEMVFREFGAKQSVYTYLFDGEGVVKKVWPGYNKAMLAELNKALSDLTGYEAEPTAHDMAPEEMTSGCFFFKPVGTEEPAW